MGYNPEAGSMISVDPTTMFGYGAMIPVGYRIKMIRGYMIG